MYKIPSELRHGDWATSWGIVKGNFFNASLSDPPKTYNEPSFGSGKNMGLKNLKVQNQIISLQEQLTENVQILTLQLWMHQQELWQQVLKKDFFLFHKEKKLLATRLKHWGIYHLLTATEWCRWDGWQQTMNHQESITIEGDRLGVPLQDWC